MGKESKKKAAASQDKTKATAQSEDGEDMPEDVREYKEKLEKETGKTYKYRPSKKDIPSIGHMLAHGAPEEEGRAKSWLELVGYPLILVLLFMLTFHLFWWINPIENSRYKKGRFSLPKMDKPPATAGGATGSSPVKSDPPATKSEEL